MKLGTGVMVWVAAGMIVSAAATPMIASALGLGGAVAIGAIAAGLMLLCAAPIGIYLNRDEGRIRAFTARLIEDGASIPAKTSPLMASIAQPIRLAVEHATAQSERTTGRVRELEISFRISAAERDRLETALQCLQDGVVITNPFGELKLINRSAAELLGVSTPDDLNRAVGEVIADSNVRRLISEAHDSGSATHRVRVEIELDQDEPEDPEAPTRTYEATIACLPDPNETIGGVVLILRNISREREISQMKSEFVSKASHELRTPLSSINAYVEMLLDGEASDEESRSEFYGVIKNEADRLGRLIDNMLNISRIEAGVVRAKYEDVDFVKAAKAAAEVIEPQAKLKDITVRLKSGPLLYSAEADRDMVHQILLNLLSNAVKYTPEGGRITVTVENDETTGSVMVCVADTGLGIPPDALPRVFEKFYRIENYKRVAKGTGLGLSLVKHIVETVHHGQITVTSELGMGSRFIVTIPYTRKGALGVAA